MNWPAFIFVQVLGVVLFTAIIFIVRWALGIPNDSRKANIVSAVLVGLLVVFDLLMIPVP